MHKFPMLLHDAIIYMLDNFWKIANITGDDGNLISSNVRWVRMGTCLSMSQSRFLSM